MHIENLKKRSFFDPLENLCMWEKLQKKTKKQNKHNNSFITLYYNL